MELVVPVDDRFDLVLRLDGVQEAGELRVEHDISVQQEVLDVADVRLLDALLHLLGHNFCNVLSQGLHDGGVQPVASQIEPTIFDLGEDGQYLAVVLLQVLEEIVLRVDDAFWILVSLFLIFEEIQVPESLLHYSSFLWGQLTARRLCSFHLQGAHATLKVRWGLREVTLRYQRRWPFYRRCRLLRCRSLSLVDGGLLRQPKRLDCRLLRLDRCPVNLVVGRPELLRQRLHKRLQYHLIDLHLPTPW